MVREGRFLPVRFSPSGNRQIIRVYSKTHQMLQGNGVRFLGLSLTALFVLCTKSVDFLFCFRQTGKQVFASSAFLAFRRSVEPEPIQDSATLLIHIVFKRPTRASDPVYTYVLCRRDALASAPSDNSGSRTDQRN